MPTLMDENEEFLLYHKEYCEGYLCFSYFLYLHGLNVLYLLNI